MNEISSIGASFPASMLLFDNLSLPGTATNESIASVSKDFDSLFYSLMIKEMRNAAGNEEDGGLFPGDQSDSLGGLFDLYLGRHLASSGQLGIGQMLATYLAQQQS